MRELELILEEFGITGISGIEKVEREGNGFIFQRGRLSYWGDEDILFPEMALYLLHRGVNAGEVERVPLRPPYQIRGFHLDLPRGATPTQTFWKKIIRHLFLGGYNLLAIYFEDLFPWKRHPLIGWGQGKMSMDEINEVIDYAGTFGIEVIPSLELCGHMEKILSLEPYSEYSEMGGVLDGDRRECQKFVSELLEEALQFFPSEYIHIGGDETWFLGRGKSLNRYRVFKGPEIYVRLHKMLIEKVLSCGKIPILWGDMLLGGYVDKGVSEVWREVIDERIWEKCIIANWDYAPSREESFREKIETMEKRGLTQWVSPGLHDANKFYPNIESAEQNVTSFLQAGRGTNGFLVTSWGDDGRESLYSHILPLLFIPRALWNKSSWEKEWEEVSRESKGIISARKLFGNKVLSTTHKMFLYSNPYLRKYDGNFEKVKDDYEKAISVEVSLPEELAMIKELYTLCHQKYTGGVPPQRYISLAKRYRDVWLKERKPYGVERIFGRLWYTAGLTECSLPQMSRDAAAGSKFEHIVEPNHG